MLFEVTLIGLAFLIAVFGTLEDHLGRTAKIVLVVLALGVAVANIAKTVNDQDEKRWMRAVLSSNLRLSPEEISRLFQSAQRISSKRGYDAVDYNESDNGLVFFLTRNADIAAIVLTNWDLGVLTGKSTRDVDADLNRHFGESYPARDEEFEDKHKRIGILCAAAAASLASEQAGDYHWDSSIGVRVHFELQGRRTMIQVSPEDIASVPRSAKALYFGRVAETCRDKYNVARNSAQTTSTDQQTAPR
jgi:hypothetical protein